MIMHLWSRWDYIFWSLTIWPSNIKCEPVLDAMKKIFSKVENTILFYFGKGELSNLTNMQESRRSFIILRTIDCYTKIKTCSAEIFWLRFYNALWKKVIIRLKTNDLTISLEPAFGRNAIFAGNIKKVSKQEIEWVFSV